MAVIVIRVGRPATYRGDLIPGFRGVLKWRVYRDDHRDRPGLWRRLGRHIKDIQV